VTATFACIWLAARKPEGGLNGTTPETNQMSLRISGKSPLVRKLSGGGPLTGDSGFAYPWDGLEEKILSSPEKSVKLLGYGSLLNLQSAVTTIPGAARQEFAPALAVGAKRVFDYAMPDDLIRKRGGDVNGPEKAALNVRFTGHTDDILNGRILLIGVADVAALRTREYGYNLRPVRCIPWHAPDSEPFVAYVLAAESEMAGDRRVLDSGLLPNLPYVRLCYLGARSVSTEFSEVFLDTSFLPDGRTSLRTWLETKGVSVEDWR
jgi:hypothetical protein